MPRDSGSGTRDTSPPCRPSSFGALVRHRAGGRLTIDRPIMGRPCVSGHRNLPAGGQQTLPTHGHLLTQGARGGGHDSPAGAALDRHLGAMSHGDMAARSVAGRAGCRATRAVVRVEPRPLPTIRNAETTRVVYWR